jgi:glycosyltransferase involved in cell wall biosynthesis
LTSKSADPHAQGHSFRRRVLLVNLDFRDVVYSHLWGRAVLAGCMRRGFAVDMVAVNPVAGRDLAAELGVPRSALDVHGAEGVVYVDQPDESRYRCVIGQLLDRGHYNTLILNCDAALFVHLMVDRARDFDNTQWLVYDRHLHIDLRAHDRDTHLRDRMTASGMHLYTIEEIATAGVSFGVEREIVPNQETIIRSFQRLGLTPERLHVQQWPLDDDFFAPQPDAAPKDAFVVFTGGDSGRDYGTLFEAIGGLPIQLRLCARNYPTPVPANVTILPRLALHQFRDEVARATLVVVPLTGEPPASGITVIAMAKMLGKPVVASDNRVVRLQIRSQGEGGYLTQTGNAALLRSLLTGLIASPAERERLGREGRAQAVRDCSLKAFAERMLELQ